MLHRRKAIFGVMLFVVMLLLAGCDSGAEECKGCISLSELELPADAEVISDGLLDAILTSHPLTTAPAGYTADYFTEEDLPKVQAYKAVYDSILMLPSEQVVVGCYSYAYVNKRDAKIATVLVQEMLEARTGITIADVPLTADADITGKQYIAVSPEDGDTVMWYIGVRNNVLVMLMVNGMDGGVVADRFGVFVNTVFGE